MEQTDYTYITSRMLTEICEHTEVLRKGLLVILLVLAAALTLFLIPVDNPRRSASPSRCSWRWERYAS